MKGSLQEKSGKYYAVFRSDGKQKWVNLDVPTTKGHKREAEQLMKELLEKLTENPLAIEKVDFAIYVDVWLNNVKHTVDIITYEGYEQYAKKHIIPYFQKNKVNVQDIKISNIEDYYNYKAKGGRLDGKSGGLSLRSIKAHSVVLNLVLKQAMYEGLINTNPCTYAKIPKTNISVKKTEPCFYTVEECNRLLEIIKGKPLYNMVYISLFYGLRRSEMLGLKWDAVDFKNDTISIQHTVVLHKSIARKDKTKNSSSKRVYPLLPEIKEMIQNMLLSQEKNRELLGDGFIESGYIFTRENGTPYYPSYPTHELTKVLKQNNLPHIRWHDLRHSAASMLVEKGWHMKDISNWLGHSNISTTMNVYGHISMEHKRKLGDSLFGIFDI